MLASRGLAWSVAGILAVALAAVGFAWAQERKEAREPLFVVPAGLEAGSNEMLRAPLTNEPNLEVIVSDVVIPPGASVPPHYHPGEEFLYLIEGTAVHVERGKPDLPLKVGDTYVIPPEAVHAPRGGPQGARAIVFRVHRKGQPERIAAGSAAGSREN